MQVINRWRNWKPNGEKFCDSPRHELPKLPKPDSVSFVSAIPAQMEKIRPIEDIPADEPDAWEPAFASWMQSTCVYRDRCFGGVGSLYLSFAEHCAAGTEVAPCTRATFERLLINANFLLADGMVSGLIFKSDLEAAFTPLVSMVVREKPAQRKGWAA